MADEFILQGRILQARVKAAYNPKTMDFERSITFQVDVPESALMAHDTVSAAMANLSAIAGQEVLVKVGTVQVQLPMGAPQGDA
jgi:uncharacterized alkaline shock family protein YloU